MYKGKKSFLEAMDILRDLVEKCSEVDYFEVSSDAEKVGTPDRYGISMSYEPTGWNNITINVRLRA